MDKYYYYVIAIVIFALLIIITKLVGQLFIKTKKSKNIALIIDFIIVLVLVSCNWYFWNPEAWYNSLITASGGTILGILGVKIDNK